MLPEPRLLQPDSPPAMFTRVIHKAPFAELEQVKGLVKKARSVIRAMSSLAEVSRTQAPGTAEQELGGGRPPAAPS